MTRRLLSIPPVRRPWVVAGATIAAVAGLALFLETADDQSESDGKASDWRILRGLRSGAPGDPIGPSWVTQGAEEFSALGGVAPITALTLAVGGGLLLGGRRKAAALVAVSYTGALLLSEGLKRVFDRGRPPPEYQIGVGQNESFPSGHALLSSVVFLTLGSILARSVTSVRMKGYILGTAATTAIGVGLSRTYLGLHWANDVLGGWGLGAAWAMLCWLLLGERRPSPPWRRWIRPRV